MEAAAFAQKAIHNVSLLLPAALQPDNMTHYISLRGWDGGSLQAEVLGVRTPMSARFSGPILTDHETYPASCAIGQFPGVKRLCLGAHHPSLPA